MQGAIGRPAIQQLFGVGALEEARCAFFSLGPYSNEAKSWAVPANVALFRLSGDGECSPSNEAAEALIRPVVSDAMVIAGRELRRRFDALESLHPPENHQKPFGFVLGATSIHERIGETQIPTPWVLYSSCEFEGIRPLLSFLDAVAAELAKFDMPADHRHSSLTIGGTGTTWSISTLAIASTPVRHGSALLIERSTMRITVDLMLIAAATGGRCPPPFPTTSRCTDDRSREQRRDRPDRWRTNQRPRSAAPTHA
jgi:hypothetical protein